MQMFIYNSFISPKQKKKPKKQNPRNHPNSLPPVDGQTVVPTPLYTLSKKEKRTLGSVGNTDDAQIHFAK